MKDPKSYWSNAILTTCYLISRIPLMVHSGISPFHVSAVLKILLILLIPWVFGCICFVHNLGHQSEKLSPKVVQYIFLRYSHSQKGFNCYDPLTRRWFIYTDATFFKTTTHYYDVSSTSPPSPLPLLVLPSPPKPLSNSSQPRNVYTRRSKPLSISPTPTGATSSD